METTIGDCYGHHTTLERSAVLNNFVRADLFKLEQVMRALFMYSWTKSTWNLFATRCRNTVNAIGSKGANFKILGRPKTSSV